MFDARGRDEKRTRQGPPLCEPIGVAKNLGMGFHGLPRDDQAVLGRILDDPFEPHAMTALGLCEVRLRVGDGFLELVGTRRLYGQKGDFRDHRGSVGARTWGGKQ